MPFFTSAGSNETKPADVTAVIYYRLIALWVLCEAMLGSIIFTFRLPVSGLIIGSCAVICISLIAWFSPAKGSILKATIIVAIFKMMLTPQAPPPAYIAVFFQGLLGETLFWKRKYFSVACIVLAVLAMLESAFQRVIVVTVIYGDDVWMAINQFLNRLAGSKQVTDYSYFIIFCYVLVHLVAGIVVGLWAGFLPYKLENMNNLLRQYLFDPSEVKTEVPVIKKRKKTRWLLLVTWLFLLLLYTQSFFNIGPPLLPKDKVLYILLRSFIIVLTWHFLISPVLKHLLHKWLQKRKQQSAAQVQQVLNLLPATKNMIARCWQLSAGRRGLKRIFFCCQIILANTFHTPGLPS